MNKRNFVPISYALLIAFFGVAIFGKTIHSIDTSTMLAGCILTQLLFVSLSIYELRKSEQLTKREKADWTVFLLLSPPIFGMMYLTSIRKRILQY